MRSVTEQLTGEAPAGVEPENKPSAEKMAEAKLRLAYATRNPQHAARPTGVRLVSPGHEQVQEIFDDGSVRNPYRANHTLSGRQRKKMRKLANRNMKARGIDGRIEDVLKGRRVGPSQRPQPATTESPAPAAAPAVSTGMSVADVFGD